MATATRPQIISWLSDGAENKRHHAALGRHHNRRLVKLHHKNQYYEVTKTLDIVWEGSPVTDDSELLAAVDAEVQKLIRSNA